VLLTSGMGTLNRRAGRPIIFLPQKIEVLATPAIYALLIAAVVAAEAQRPTPVPQVGAGCPTGYSAFGGGVRAPVGAPDAARIPRLDPVRVDVLADVAHVR
jgi:hypothetical protein